MAVSFITTNPQNLLASFDARIRQSEPKGKITTWLKANDGVHYTHKAPEWTEKAWFRPAISSGMLTFNIVKPANSSVATTTYGYYHGHLTETFLNHFDEMFTNGQSTAMPVQGDLVK